MEGSNQSYCWIFCERFSYTNHILGFAAIYLLVDIIPCMVCKAHTVPRQSSFLGRLSRCRDYNRQYNIDHSFISTSLTGFGYHAWGSEVLRVLSGLRRITEGRGVLE